MNSKSSYVLCGAVTAALLLFVACGAGTSSSAGSQPVGTQPQSGTVSMLLSDDATQDWATIGVKVLSISLVPQGGGAAVNVYTAPSTPPTINLVQLDQLAEIIGNASVPLGTYTDAKLTLSANPGDVTLVASAEPEASFDVPAGQTVPTGNIQIKGAAGSSGSLTVPLTIHLAQPLTVTANSSNALDLEFDLKHPTFLVEHYPANATAPLWAVSFNGPVRHHPFYDLTRILLRHTYGQVTGVSSDDTSITIAKDYPTYPVPASGQVPIASSVSLTFLADATNGTIFYDLDAGTKTTIKSFSSVAASLLNDGTGKYVRIAARYQAGGTLVAVRIWASSSFEKVWVSPEGHVVHVDTTNNVMSVCNENGQAVPVTISSSTQFFFRTPASTLADTQPIGTGTSFFDGLTPGDLPNLTRGFKVHVSVVDPLAATFTADTVDIEIARYDGTISAATNAGAEYTHTFVTVKDDYTGTLPYIASGTANGTDSNGNAITGFYWWYFTLPTQADTGASAVGDFVTAVNNAANFGGTIPTQKVWGVSYSRWGDGGTVNTTDWYADWAVIEPTPLPLGQVAAPWATLSNGGSFGMTVTGGANTVSVDLSTVSGSATLVYQVDNTGGIVTVTPMDLTNATQLGTVEQALGATGTKVKVFGVPTTSGAIQAYVVFYYTGTPTTK
jgi:hypothetical protein